MLQIDTYQEKYNYKFMSYLLRSRMASICDSMEMKYAKVNTGALSDFIIGAYGSSDRHHHGLRHLVTLFDLYDRIQFNIPDVEKRIALQYAILFHDSKYIAQSGDSYNIPESIKLANISLRDDSFEYFRLLVGTYITATNHYHLFTHQDIRNSMSLEEKYISDMDLAGFAFETPNFDINNENVRKEFSYLSDVDFNEGQIKFMKLVLSLDKIYLTEFFSVHEDAARKNIESLIEILSQNNQQ